MQLVTVTEAARLRNLNKSTVSRQVRAWKLPMQGGRFDLAVYDGLRAGELDPSRVDNPQHGIPAIEAPAATPASAGKREEFIGIRSERERHQAELTRLDLLERTGKLVPVHVVEQRERELLEGIERGAVLLRDGLLGLALRVAGQLASMTDPAEIRGVLDEEHRRLLETFQHVARGAEQPDDVAA